MMCFGSSSFLGVVELKWEELEELGRAESSQKSRRYRQSSVFQAAYSKCVVSCLRSVGSGPAPVPGLLVLPEAWR